jgi:hypothetical protein
MEIGLYKTEKSVTIFFESREQTRWLAEALTALANDDSVTYVGKLPSFNLWKVRPVKGTKQFRADAAVHAGERREGRATG